jgi:hypothetical protein
MLELKTYKKAELVKILGTNSRQGIKRKLNGYGISYTIEGRGETLTITITNIADPFKLFCITDLGFPAQCDFHKLRNFFYYFLNDEEFRTMPDEIKEHRLRDKGKDVSRQTIRNWLRRLEKQDILYADDSHCIYYFAFKDTQTITDYQTYKKAWQEYWKNTASGIYSWEAISIMRQKYGGIARRQPIMKFNAFYIQEINTLNKLVCESIENEIQE